MTECSIEACPKPVKARGYCRLHWEHWYINGDPLSGTFYRVGGSQIETDGDTSVVWLSDGTPCYIDTADVPLVSRISWSRLKGPRTSYAKRSDGRLMHRIIMDAPRRLVVDHIDWDGLNNRRSNMRLVTQSENMMNRYPRHPVTP